MKSSKKEAMGRMGGQKDMGLGMASGRVTAWATFLMGIAILTVLPCCATGQAVESESDFAGTWKGELGAGAAKLRIVLTITKGAGGEFSGQLVSVDQGATLPMENISVEGDAVRFEVKPVGGLYEGKLNAARTEVEGTWVQARVARQPLSFTRSTE